MIYGLGSNGFDSDTLLAQRQTELQRVVAEREEAEREYAALKSGQEYRSQLKSDYRAKLASEVEAKSAPQPVYVPPPKKRPVLLYVAFGLGALLVIRSLRRR